MNRINSLNPCPFCGKQPVLSATMYEVVIKCENEDCKVKPVSKVYNSVNKAEESWNSVAVMSHDEISNLK